MAKYLIIILISMAVNHCVAQTKRLYRLAEKQINRKDWEGAKRTLFKIYDTGNIDCTLIRYIGDCFQSLDKLDSAGIFYQKALSFEEASIDAPLQSNIALYYLKISDIDKALMHMNKAIEIDGRGHFYIYRGLIYYHMKNYYKACEDLKLGMEIGNSFYSDKTLLGTNCNDFPTEEQTDAINKIHYTFSVLLPLKSSE